MALMFEKLVVYRRAADFTDGDGDVDATDKGTPGTTCTGTVNGACRILDLDPALDTAQRAKPAVALRPVRRADSAESRVHGDYGERSERERAAIGKVSRDAPVRPATCPEGASTT